MNKKRLGAAFLALLMCGLVSQASARDAKPKFNSNGDDIASIRGLLDEFRQDIIRKDGQAEYRRFKRPFRAVWRVGGGRAQEMDFL